MKTPEEIKKGLECCASAEIMCGECPYYEDGVDCEGIEEDALALIQQLEERVPKWTDVMDGLPVNEDDVLVLIGGKDADVGWFNGYDGNWRTYGCVAGEVTHWMPLPEPPKEG